MNGFWFHEKCPSVLFITFKHHHVSTANEPKKKKKWWWGALSPPTPALLALSCTCQSSGHQSPCPREDSGRRQGTCCQPPSCLAQPGWQLRLIASPCLFKSHPSTSFFHPCQVPGPHLHPQPPLPLGLAGFPQTNVLFLALMDILALQPLLHTRLNTMPILI